MNRRDGAVNFQTCDLVLQKLLASSNSVAQPCTAGSAVEQSKLKRMGVELTSREVNWNVMLHVDQEPLQSFHPGAGPDHELPERYGSAVLSHGGGLWARDLSHFFTPREAAESAFADRILADLLSREFGIRSRPSTPRGSQRPFRVEHIVSYPGHYSPTFAFSAIRCPLSRCMLCSSQTHRPIRQGGQRVYRVPRC